MRKSTVQTSQHTNSAAKSPLNNSAAHSSQQSTRKTAKLQERGIPQPFLGPQGQDLNNNNAAEESKKGNPGARNNSNARGGGKKSAQIHNHDEDPFAILENQQPYHEQLEQLRDSFIVYKENCSRCRIQLRPKQIGEQFKKYYFQPKVPFLDDPEKQKSYRKNLINEVSRLPEPEPLYLMADKMHLDCLETIGDRSNPAIMREDLGRFYLRRSAQLQHKKYKLLIRWANSQLRSPDLDNVHQTIDQHLSILQQEQDNINNRLERLMPDDKYEGATHAERPSPTTKIKHQPSDAHEANIMDQMPGQDIGSQAAAPQYQEELTKLYIEKTEDRSVNSCIRQDDFEVYLRLKTYHNKLNRLGNKLVNKLKWLPFLKRFDMWQESRERIFAYRDDAIKEKSNTLQRISIDIKKKLEGFGETDEKAIVSVTERYTFHLKETQFISRVDQILSSHRTDVKKPYMLFASNIELKLKIQELAESYPNLSTLQLDIDNGQQFTYQMQSLFPDRFESQVMQGQFDIEDTGRDPDRQLLERLVKNLGLSRYDILKEISQYSEKQRRNSILGALGYNTQLRKAEDEGIENNIKSESHEEFSEQNLIRKIKTIDFFSLSELKLKLRYADWLDYVCFEPAISEAQKQQNNLLSASDNPIDQLLKGAFDSTDVHDQVSINKILEEASSSHISKIQSMQHKIIQGESILIQQISGKDADTTGLQASLSAAIRPEAVVRKAGAESAQNEINKAQMKRYEHIQNIDQLNLSLVKNYYSLRLLQSREYKQKLLSLVNYFRGVQRILAFDLKEHVTRDKGVGEKKDLIEPHFGRDGSDKNLSKMAGQTGPGKIFAINLNRRLDSGDHDAGVHDPVTINCYKYNGLFNAKSLSTNPMLPKYHRTFGRPSLYESLSGEVDRKTKILHQSEEMQCLMVKRDKIIVEPENKQVKIYNEFGQLIMYDEAINDMIALEEEMIKIGSYFINQHEYLQASNDIETATASEESKMDKTPNTRPSSMIDRQEIAIDLLKSELDFQFAKVELVEKLLEAYEHIYDPLESVRSLQMIVDAMSQRPRLNTEASMYTDSYDSETKLLQEKTRFFSDLITLQSDHEKQENKAAFDFQEMKVKMVSDAVTERFKLEEQHKVPRVGSDENDPDQVTEEQFKMEQKIQVKLENKQAKKEALLEIQKKHITEYANEQYTNFAQVLGLPEISMEDLVNKRDQKEPIIQDAIREQTFFTKSLEGYPLYFSGNKLKGTTLGLHTDNVGLLDFFESYTIIPKINAALFQAFETLSDSLKPENGLASSILEFTFIQEARLNLADMVDIFHNGMQDVPSGLRPDDYTTGQNLLEEDFYMANSDKILFMMKEFKAEMDPANLYRTANPLVVSKLDIKSVGNYNFPRINMAEVSASLQDAPKKDNDMIVRRMIELARDSCARQLLDKRDRVEQSCDDDDDAFETVLGKDDKIVRSPSMMKMACNMMEVIRVREELINRISECNTLTQVYQQQLSHADKPNKVNNSDQINFNHNSILKDQINIVDSNHGLNKEFKLPFMEFDKDLSINLDLKSESCIKALMTDLGLEELRGILHYQVMHQQLLTVAVMTNQLLIDGPMKGQRELDLLEKQNIVVPNSVLNLTNIISATSDGQNFQQMKQERQRLNQCISGLDCLYNVLPKKSRDRETVLKKFQKVQARLVQKNEFKPELCLRILRSYRLKLLHESCQNVLKEVYLDSIKVQTLQTNNLLRWKATLLPITQEKLFTVGRGSVMENISTFAQTQLYGTELGATQATVNVRDILNGQIMNSSIFYIPHADEVIKIDRQHQIEEMTQRQQLWLDIIEQDVLGFDDQIKELVKMPHLLNESFQPGITHLKEMTTQAQKSSSISSKNTDSVLPQNRVMSQIQQNAGVQVKRSDDQKLQMYKIEPQSRQKYGYRKVNFQEAHDYGQKDVFRLLTYMSLILKIFTLEYIMGRNNTPSRQILEMEQKILTGREFWTSIDRMKVLQDINQLRYGDHSDEIKQRLILNETAADRVIDRILERKKTWYELSEDMKSVQTRVRKLDTQVKDLPHEKRTIFHLNDLLILQHQATYYHFLNGLENILEIYRDKKQDEHFYKVMDVRNMAIKRNQGLVLNLRNGFYVSQASVHPSHISLNSSDKNEFSQFIQQYHPVIDERALIPRQINMMQRIYGVSSDLDNSSKDCLIDSWMTNYANLQNIFYNLDDRSRSFIGTNFPQNDDLVKEYLIYKGILAAPRRQKENKDVDSNDGAATSNAPERRQTRKGQNYMTEYLLATVEILSYKIEAAHMQRVLMGWISGEGTLPGTTIEYTNIMRKYQDMTTLRILQERDHLNDIYFFGERSDPQEQLKAGVSPDKLGRDRKRFLDPEIRKTSKFSFFDRVNLIRAETNVIKRLLDQKMIQIGTRMITNEHSALSAAIDFAGSQDQIQEFVHPQQQFASTMLQDVDKLGHLDIVNKIGFVQQFLTRLRNRCTEVDTLTSGPGIVFSMKDFNECIAIFCKQALKYSEENLRQRTETSQIMGNQYRHLIYLKEMEVVYYRSKCEQFLRNIDVIVNTKMSAKGNQMIYELDVNNRELRYLKDHYYLMERYMREEIQKEFLKKIHTKDNNIVKLQDDFGNYRNKISHELQHECAEEIDDLHKTIEALKSGKNLGKISQNVVARGNQNLVTDADAATPENYKVILKLESHIRKYKSLTLMKQVITEEKHQRELKEMELKLTLNASLWEQLSESQKRESITRQELELTKRNLTHYEKLIERLYIQLEQLNNEKVRLQRFKSSKLKKISELESKMKDLEILENIDLDKILSEMRSRDKKIERLELVDNEFKNRIDTTQKQASNQIKGIEKLLSQEREAKNEAFAKLESMRIEMKALEGTDIKNDLWKDKCKELYEISKDLELENDGLRSGLTQLQTDKSDLQRMNEQLLSQQRQGYNIKQSNGQLSDQQTIAETQLNSATSRHPTLGTKPYLRENMILNRKALVKPMTAKANSYAQKRAQSGHPGAARNPNRLFQRNMTNAQSYHYDRGQMSGEPMQQTLFLSNNTSYPAFSSDVEINSLGLKQGIQNGAGTRNLIVGGANMGGKYPSNQASNAQHRYSAVGPQGGQRMPNLANTKKQSMGNYAQSTRTMHQQMGVQPQGHGVLSSNVIPNSSNFITTGSAKNSGLMQTAATNMIPQPVGLMKNTGARLHSTQGGRATGSRIRGQVQRGGSNTQHQLLGYPQQMGIVGNTVHQSGHPSFNEPGELNIDSKQMAVSSASMVGITKDHLSMEQLEFQMQQEMLQNQAQFEADGGVQKQ